MRVPFASILGVGLLAAACNNNNNAVLTPLPAPDSLQSVSLDKAIDLFWADNAFESAPARFVWYRIYSTSYTFGADYLQGACGTSWSLEGATVAPEFLVGAVSNGVPRCYAVTAISTDGAESDRSPQRFDTPRPDARNVLVYAYAANSGASGFRFWDDANNDKIGQPSELGLVQSGTLSSIDFVVDRSTVDSSLWIIPVFTGTSMEQYGSGPIDDLTSIDLAPLGGYSGDSLKAQVGYGYVFEISDASGLHYGALRVTHVGRQYLIFDWSVQTGPGNPELVVRGGLDTAKPSGSVVAAASH